MKSKDQQLLEEAYSKVFQLNESVLMDVVQWIASFTGADAQVLYSLYVKDLVQLVLQAGVAIVGVIAIAVIAVATYLKLNLSEIKEKIRKSKIGKQVAELIDKHGTDPEIISLLESWSRLKGDRSAEAVTERKAIAEKLKAKVEGTGVFDKGDVEAIDRGIKSLKSNY